MGRVLGFVGLLMVVGIGAYIYMRQAQSVMPAGASNPRATVDLVGVRSDLLAMAQAERSYSAMNGKFVSLDELRSQGSLAMTRNNRGPYTYSAEVSEGGFRIVATNNGAAGPGMPKSISVDSSMEIREEQ